MSDFYDISVTLADGTTTTMGGWAGHVLLIANPASTSAHADILAELFTDYAPAVSLPSALMTLTTPAARTPRSPISPTPKNYSNTWARATPSSSTPAAA